MKKLCVLLTATFLTMTLLAQEDSSAPLTNKKGVPIHPAAGDWAIGIDATPFFQYIGNFFAGNNNYRPEFGFTANNPGAIYGKYVLSRKTLIRAIIHIGATTETERIINPVDEDNPHKMTESALSIGLTAGIEKNKNIAGRFSGIYGAQLGFMSLPYEDASGYVGRVRYKDANDSDLDYTEKGGRTHTIGVGGFIGVEFFVAPKVSLSGEFGLNLVGSLTGKRVYKPATGNEITLDLGGASVEFSPEASGDLVLIFYF